MMRRSIVAVIVTFGLIVGYPLHADYLVVGRKVIVHSEASSASDELARSDVGDILRLQGTQQTNGYYQIQLADGEVGYVYRTFVRRKPGSPPNPGAASGALPTYERLEDCPPHGRTHEGSPHAVTNEVKRNLITSGTPKHLSFDDFATLQNSAEHRGVTMGNSSHMALDVRTKKLSGFKIGGQTISEGDYVALAGYLDSERKISAGGKESVNCGLTGIANTDVHLPIVADPDDTEYSSIVIEPIPQDRPAAWTIKEYKRLQAARRKIMVYGQLFFDNVHYVRDDPDNEEGLTSQPKRFTVWEVHPVSRIFECVKPDASCDPKTVSQWKEIK